MWKPACLSLMLLLVAPAFPQAASPIAPIGFGSSDRMVIPPPVSEDPFPTELLSETQSNYLRADLSFSAGYVENLYPGSGSSTINAQTYSILPKFSLNQTMPRQRRVFSYSPGFTFYEPTTALNEFDQNATLSYEYLMTPHTAVKLNDYFVQSRGNFSAAASPNGAPFSGSLPAMINGVVAPFAEQISNDATALVSLQLSPHALVGATGVFQNLYYPKPSEAPGLFDSKQLGGGGFYARRISFSQYVGIGYKYSEIMSYPPGAESFTHLHTPFAFYTIYPNKNFSISISGGPQHYELQQTALPTASSWKPMLVASTNWQAGRAGLSLVYSRTVNAGGGLVGAYNSNDANGELQWRVLRPWKLDLLGYYVDLKSVTPLLLVPTPLGHSVSGGIRSEHQLGESLTLSLEYDRLYQTFDNVPVISNNPDSNRGLVTLVWRFDRPLGR